MQKVGSLVYSTKQGLGYLAKSFYDAKVVTDVMVVAHGRREEFTEQWYPNSQTLNGLSANVYVEKAQNFCKSVDTMLFFETPFIWDLIPYCKSIGVKTVLMVMYECMPKSLPHIPDVILCPSKLDYDYYKSMKDETRVCHIPVPVDKTLVRYRRRQRAEVFVHNAGHGGLSGRNGTTELYQALSHVKSPITLILRSQDVVCDHLKGFISQNRSLKFKVNNVTVDYRYGTFEYEDLYSEGDVFIFPEKFNGLSLPLQEARASGMLVMTTQRHPNTSWLPHSPLIPVKETVRTCIHPRLNDIDVSILEPKTIAQTMDQWYGKDIEGYSMSSKQWTDQNSWDALSKAYKLELYNAKREKRDTSLQEQ